MAKAKVAFASAGEASLTRTFASMFFLRDGFLGFEPWSWVAVDGGKEEGVEGKPLSSVEISLRGFGMKVLRAEQQEGEYLASCV
ncbi:hypothetical protein NL676_000527 [Syzygium grande]|nr:hypothetical protein NL676_000527 [Syzygium grande]